MGAVFLSASVPAAGREGYETADAILIREAVSALVEVVLGRKLLVWGGHPAITPMIWASAASFGIDYGRSVRLFQSLFWEDQFPEDNRRFQNVTYVQPVAGDMAQSLLTMRRAMLTAYQFDAAVFIGGMNGIRDEFRLFRGLNSEAKLIPVASPGGVSRTLFSEVPGMPADFRTAFNYTRWFYRLLGIKTTDPRRPEALLAEATRGGRML